MGAGQQGAGLGPAGLDPLPDVTDPPLGVPPVALLFDGETKDFPLDSQGRYRSVGIGAQKAQLALLRQFGKLPIAITQGLDMDGVVPVAGTKLSAEVNSRVRAALAQPLAAREIHIIDIQGESPVRGGIKISVRFNDLTDPLAAPYTVTIG